MAARDAEQQGYGQIELSCLQIAVGPAHAFWMALDSVFRYMRRFEVPHEPRAVIMPVGEPMAGIWVGRLGETLNDLAREGKRSFGTFASYSSP